jgi:hypothetical protein
MQLIIYKQLSPQKRVPFLDTRSALAVCKKPELRAITMVFTIEAVSMWIWYNITGRGYSRQLCSKGKRQRSLLSFVVKLDFIAKGRLSAGMRKSFVFHASQGH